MPGTVTPWRNLKTLNISGNDQLDLFKLRLTFYVSLIEFVAFFVLFLVKHQIEYRNNFGKVFEENAIHNVKPFKMSG